MSYDEYVYIRYAARLVINAAASAREGVRIALTIMPTNLFISGSLTLASNPHPEIPCSKQHTHNERNIDTAPHTVKFNIFIYIICTYIDIYFVNEIVQYTCFTASKCRSSFWVHNRWVAWHPTYMECMREYAHSAQWIHYGEPQQQTLTRKYRRKWIKMGKKSRTFETMFPVSKT